MSHRKIVETRGTSVFLALLIWCGCSVGALQAQSEDPGSALETDASYELAVAKQEISGLREQLREARAEAKKYREIALKNREIALKVKAVAEQWQEKCALAEAQVQEERIKYNQLNARLNRVQSEPGGVGQQGYASARQQPSQGSPEDIAQKKMDQQQRLQQAGSPPNFSGLLGERYPMHSSTGTSYSIRNISAPEMVYRTPTGYCWLVTFDVTAKRPKPGSDRRELVRTEGKGYGFFQRGRLLTSRWGTTVRVPMYYDSNNQRVYGRQL